jgi:alkylhydroperoxidase family enzyme
MAETITRVAETAMPEVDYQSARAVFSEKGLVDLTIAIGLMNTSNRMAIDFRNQPQVVLAHSAGCWRARTEELQ